MSTIKAKRNAARRGTISTTKLLSTSALTAAGLLAIAMNPARADDLGVPDVATPDTTATTIDTPAADPAPWTGFTDEEGTISVDTPTTTNTNITQNSSLYVGTSANLDIPDGYHVNIDQASSNWLFVAKAAPHADPTYILGQLTADGRVIIIDRNGVFTGPNSSIDVSGIVMTTGDVDVEALKASDLKALKIDNITGGRIDLNGTVSVADAGLAAFVAPTVVNNGVINAKLGKVAIGSGEVVTLDLYGDNLLEIGVKGKVADAIIENNGQINAEGGIVQISAKQAKEAVDSIINNKGVINASSATQVGGKIILSGGDSGKVSNSGTLNARGTTGGDITVTGQYVAAEGSAVLDASGTHGGGTIRFGGDYQGGGNTPTSGYAYVGQDAILRANADEDGDGGDIFIWSDEATGMYGKAEAKGGANSGDGGFVEVSSLGFYDFKGLVDTTAANGNTGMLLLDPLVVRIIGGFGDGHDNGGAAGAGTSGGWNNMGDNSGTGTLPYTAPSSDSENPYTIYESEIEAQSVSTNITIQARRSIETQAGVAPNLGTNSGIVADNNVTLAANRNLTIETRNNAGDGAGSINLSNLKFTTQGTGTINVNGSTAGNSASNVTVGQLQTAGGAVNVKTNNGTVTFANTVNTNGGNINATATGLMTVNNKLSTENAAGAEGNIFLTANDLAIGGSGALDAAEGATGDDGTVTITRATDGSIAVGGANAFGDMRIDNAELAKITAKNLNIGDINEATSKVTNIEVDGVNTSANISGLVTLSTWLNVGTGVPANAVGTDPINNNNVGFLGSSTFNALTINANDHLVLYTSPGPSATIDVLNGDFNVNADDNAQGVGGLYMGSNTGINTHGHNFTFGGHEVFLANNAKINAAGGNILLNNNDVFYSVAADSLNTSGTGTITLNQWDKTVTNTGGIFGSASFSGSINNAVRALNNTGTGLNTVKVGAGTYDENVLVDQSNTLIWSYDGRNATTVNGQSGVGALGTFVVGNNINNTQIGDINHGFTINGIDNGAPGIENSAVYYQGAHNGAIVKGNKLVAIGDEALTSEYGQSNSNFTIDSNIITGNTFTGADGAWGLGDQFVVPNVPRQLVAFNNGLSNLTFSNNEITGNSGIQHLVAIESNGANIYGNTFDGLSNTTDLRLRGSDINVHDNSFDGNGRGRAIWATNVNNLKIDTNIINNTGLDAILITDGTGTTSVRNNKIGTLGAAGNINGNGISNVNTTSTIADNTISNFTGAGVLVDPSPNTIVENNVINGGVYGVEVLDSAGVRVRGNDITGSQTGVYANNAHDIWVHDNDIIGSTVAGVHILNSGGTNYTDDVDVFFNRINVAGTANGVWIENSNFATVGAHLTNQPFANDADDGNTITGGVNGVVITNSNDAMVRYNNIGGTSADGVEVNGGTRVNVLNNTIHDIGWDGVQFNGSTAGLIKDNNITNVTGASGVAVMYGSNGTTVENNTINGTDRLGVYAWNSDNLNIVGNTITDTGREGGNNWFLSAIHLEGVDNSTVDNNKIDGSNGSGIRVGGAGNQAAQNTSGNVIKNNKIQNVAQDGIRVLDSAGVQITSNKVGYEFDGTTPAGTDNIKGDGILVSNSDGAQIKTNTVTETHSTAFDKGSSIQVLNSDDVVIDANNLTNSGWDYIRVDAEGGTLNNLKITNNVGKNNGAILNGAERVGIYAEGLTNSLIDKNQISETERYAGIYLNGGHDNKITNNTVKNSDEVGILLSGVTGSNLIDKNEITNTGLQRKASDGSNSGDGIQVRNSGGTNVAFTTISNNKVGSTGGANNINGDGVSVYDSNYTVVSGNTIDETTGNGIFIDPSDYSVIAGNTITDADLNGIYALNNSHIQIGTSGNANSNRNYITGTGQNGIKVEGGTDNTIRNNVINTTGVNGNPAGTTGNGIYVLNSTDANVLTNQVGYKKSNSNPSNPNTTSVANSILGDGILISGSDSAEVKGNKINGTVSPVADSGSGIQVLNSDHVVIGGAGNDRNTITNTKWDGIRVANGSDDITITNNKIDGVQRTGIYLGGVNVANVSLNDIDNALEYHGIDVDGGDDITIDNNTIDKIKQHGVFAHNVASDGLVIKNNKIGLSGGANNIGDDGIHVENSAYSDILNNQVSNTVDDGIFIDPSDYSVIAGNTLTTIGNDGIESADNSYITIGGPNAADGNTISGAGAHGINVHGGVSALIQNNTVKGGAPTLSGFSLIQGVAGAQLDGIHVENNDGVEILNNTITAGQGFTFSIGWPLFITIDGSGGNGANGNGIFVSNSDNAVIDQNLVLPDLLGNGLGAGVDGIHVEDSDNLTVGGLIPLLNGNKIFSTGRDGINIDGSNGAFVLNNIISGASFTLPLIGTISGEIGDDGIDMNDTTGTIVAGNIITDTTGDGIEFSDGTLSLMALNFITNAGDDGIDVSNSGLLALLGNQIDGTGHNGIELSDTYLTLTALNNVANAGDDGINVQDSIGTLVAGNTVTNAGDDGIDFDDTLFSFIIGNDISNSHGDGIEVSDTALSLIADNTVDNSGDDGIDLDGVALVAVTGNTVDNSNHNGIEATNAFLTAISDNDIDDSGDNGIDVRNSGLVTISGNTVTDSDDNGIFVDPSFGIDISGNIVTFSGLDGIHVEDVIGLNIANNFISFSGGDGIDVDDVLFGNISDNTVFFSGDNGIEASDIAFSNISDNNVFFSADDGINIQDAAFVDVDGNNVFFSGDDGIDLDDSVFTDITNNFVTFSGNNGIEVSDSPTVDINDNAVLFSADDGIHVTNSSFADINHNYIAFAGDDGIDVRNSGFVDIADNGIFFTLGDGIQVRNSWFADIDNNFIRFAGDDGIDYENGLFSQIHNNDIRFVNHNGIELNDSHFISIDNNVVANAEVGIFIDPSSVIFVTNNDIHDNDIGLHVAGSGNGYINVTGNTFTDNRIGAKFESGIIDLTGVVTDPLHPGFGFGNRFFGGEVGIVFEDVSKDGKGLSLVDNDGHFTHDGAFDYQTWPTTTTPTNFGGTLGHQYFEGQSDQFVTLDRGTFTDPVTGEAIWLDASDSTYFRPGFGAFSPADTGDILTADQLDFLESMFYHRPDAASRGIFFFGTLPSGLDARKFFDEFDPFNAGVAGLNVTITGLPRLAGLPAGAPGISGLNQIAPAAGEEAEGGTEEANVANIEPAAGDEANNQKASCWGDAITAAGAGAAVNYSYGGTFEESISAAASCTSQGVF